MPLLLLTANQTNQQCTDDINKSALLFSKYGIQTDETIDGSADENKELRGKLFDISGEPGTYPQFFKKTGDEYEFICNGTQLIESDDLQDAITEQLKSNPNFLEENKQYMLIKEKFKEFIK